MMKVYEKKELQSIKECIEKLKYAHFINDDEYYILNKRFQESLDLTLRLNIDSHIPRID